MVLAEALRGGASVDTVFACDMEDPVLATAASLGIPVTAVSSRVLDRLAGTNTPRGPVAVVVIPPSPPVRAVDTLILDGVSDPGNTGTLVRSAAAFGFAVEVTGDGADPWSPKVLRSAAGAHFSTSVVRRTDPVRELRAAGCLITVLTPGAGSDPRGLPDDAPIALVVGSEAHGISPEIAAAADVQVSLPMPGGMESLNAAVAGSIAMYVVRTSVR